MYAMSIRILRRHTLYEPTIHPIRVYAYCVDTLILTPIGMLRTSRTNPKEKEREREREREREVTEPSTNKQHKKLHTHSKESSIHSKLD
jgi:hypothetical protein